MSSRVSRKETQYKKLWKFNESLDFLRNITKNPVLRYDILKTGFKMFVNEFQVLFSPKD